MLTVLYKLFISVLSIEPGDAITFKKDGNDINGIITLKNIANDKSLSYKVCTDILSYFAILTLKIRINMDIYTYRVQ